MSKSNATENDFVKFVFNGTAMPGYGANLQVNFHTADPGEAGTATTAEPTYTAYAAVNVARDDTGWTICDADGTPNAAGSAAKNAAEITFPECEVGSDAETIVAVSICTSTGQLLRYRDLIVEERVVVNPNDTPRLPAGAAIFAEA
jgi:hypothetical protein